MIHCRWRLIATQRHHAIVLTLWHPLLSAVKHPVPDRVKPSCVSGHSDAQGWASECPDVKNYKWRNSGCKRVNIVCQVTTSNPNQLFVEQIFITSISRHLLQFGLQLLQVFQLSLCVVLQLNDTSLFSTTVNLWLQHENYQSLRYFWLFVRWQCCTRSCDVHEEQVFLSDRGFCRQDDTHLAAEATAPLHRK